MQGSRNWLSKCHLSRIPWAPMALCSACKLHSHLRKYQRNGENHETTRKHQGLNPSPPNILILYCRERPMVPLNNVFEYNEPYIFFRLQVINCIYGQGIPTCMYLDAYIRMVIILEGKRRVRSAYVYQWTLQLSAYLSTKTKTKSKTVFHLMIKV